VAVTRVLPVLLNPCPAAFQAILYGVTIPATLLRSLSTSTRSRKEIQSHLPLRRMKTHTSYKLVEPMTLQRILLPRMRPQFRTQDVSCRMEKGDLVSRAIEFCYKLTLLLLADPLPVYLGDSATLSFLQSIRRLVEKRLGPSLFTMDSCRTKILEATISPAASVQHNYALPDQDTAQFMIDSFFTNVRSLIWTCDQNSIRAKIA
jgi:hypothetical protein